MGKFKPKIYYSKDILISQIEKLMKIHGNIKPDAFNKKIDVSQAVTRWKAGKSPSAESLLSIKRCFGISIDWLLTGEEPQKTQVLQPIMTLAGVRPEVPADVRMEDYLAVPLVEGLTGAGYEGALPWEHISHLLWIYRPDLGRRQHHELRAIRMAPQADSMAPTLRPGDILLIDREERPPGKPLDKKAIYAVKVDEWGHAGVKRVRQVGDFWVLISDNPNYEPILLKKADNPDLIIGRVVWSWTNWVK